MDLCYVCGKKPQGTGGVCGDRCEQLVNMGWELYCTSPTAHVITADAKYGPEGTKTVCGRYLGKSFSAFYTVDVTDDNAMSLIRSYDVEPCSDCYYYLETTYPEGRWTK